MPTHPLLRRRRRRLPPPPAPRSASGFNRVHRQDLAGWSFTGGMSNYQLMGPPGWVSGSAALTPHPDWYTSVLFKQLTGSAALNVSTSGDAGEVAAASVFAWCSGAPASANASVVLSFVNPTGADISLHVTAPGVAPAPRTDFILTSSAAAYADSRARAAAGALIPASSPQDPPASLTDDAIYLNGVLMTVSAQGVLPVTPIPGAPVADPAAPIVLPPYSYGFSVYAGAAPAGC
jgi:hypothetical protein